MMYVFSLMLQKRRKSYICYDFLTEKQKNLSGNRKKINSLTDKSINQIKYDIYME